MKRREVNLAPGLPAYFVADERGVSLVVAHIEIDLRRVLAALPSAVQTLEAIPGDADRMSVRVVELDEHDARRLALLRDELK